VENSEVAKKREALEALGVSKGIYRAEHKKLKAEADAQVEPLWQHRDRFFLATYAHATRAPLAAAPERPWRWRLLWPGDGGKGLRLLSHQC